MFDAYAVAVRLKLVDEFSGVMGMVTSKLIGANTHATALQQRLDGIKKSFKEGMMVTGVGVGIGMVLNAATKEAVKLEQQMNRLKALNLGDRSTKMLADKAKQISDSVAGTTETDALRIVTEAQSITGNVQHTLDIAPTLAKMRFGIETYMDEGGKGEENGKAAESQFKDVIKLMEMRGLMRDFTQQKLQDLSDAFVKNFVGSGGQVKPSDFVAMMKTGGVAAKSLSTDFLFALGHIMQEKGGNRAGTALSSAYQTLVAGRMPQQIAETLKGLGLLRGDAVHYGKTGHVTKVDAGGLIDSALWQSRPDQYLEKYILPALLKKYHLQEGDTNGILMRLNGLSGQRTASDFFAQMFIEREQIANYMAQTKGVFGNEALYQQATKSTAGKKKDLHAKLVKAEVAFGKASLPIVIKALRIATPLVEKLGHEMERHPSILKWLIYGIAGLGISMVIAGPLMMLASGIRAVGIAAAFFQGGEAMAETATALGQFRLGLTALATPFKWLWGLLGSGLSLIGRFIPVLVEFAGIAAFWVTIGAAAAAVGVGIGWLFNLLINKTTQWLTGANTFADYLFDKLNRKELAELKSTMTIADVASGFAKIHGRKWTDEEEAGILSHNKDLQAQLSKEDAARLLPLMDKIIAKRQKDEEEAAKHPKAKEDGKKAPQGDLGVMGKLKATAGKDDLTGIVPTQDDMQRAMSAVPLEDQRKMAASMQAFSVAAPKTNANLEAIKSEVAALRQDVAALAQRPVVLNLDGRAVGRATANYLASGNAATSSSGFDPSRSPTPPGISTRG